MAGVAFFLLALILLLATNFATPYTGLVIVLKALIRSSTLRHTHRYWKNTFSVPATPPSTTRTPLSRDTTAECHQLRIHRSSNPPTQPQRNTISPRYNQFIPCGEGETEA
ncbi:hypothetical protein E2C01_061875 [Portunus trituberculatus]|uniref:Secreted protein n=1 Tax=Portunus trituberculatus TaxID=210409 RepID=A0A5B7HGI7_PORTR|nr:hypothetical protein [Portunus trituberculatus]